MIETATPAQKYLSRALAGAGLVALASPFFFNSALPGMGLSLAAMLWQAFVGVLSTIFDFPNVAARHFPVTAAAVGVLWAADLARRPVVKRGRVPLNGRDTAFSGVLAVLVLVFYIRLGIVLPSTTSMADVTITFLALAVLSWGPMVMARQEPSSETGLLIVIASVIAAALTVACLGGIGPKELVTLKHAFICGAMHLVTQAVSWLIAGRFIALLAPADRGTSGLNPMATTEPSAAPAPSDRDTLDKPVSLPSQAVTHLVFEEDWTQRFARQRAEREARIARGLPG